MTGTTRRQFLLTSAGVTAGGILLPQPVVAGAADVGNIWLHNNYTGSVDAILYHPNALDRRFGTWSFDAGEKAYLISDGKRINIQGDWRIQVEFGNKVRSAVKYLYPILKYNEDKGWHGTLSDVYDLGMDTDQGKYKITKGFGWNVDPQFGKQERDILNGAISIMCGRFLQPWAEYCPDLLVNAGVKVGDDFDRKSQVTSDDTEREMMFTQISRMRDLTESFPAVNIKYVYDERKNFAAQAYVGTVKVIREDGEVKVKGSDGKFNIEVNDFVLNNPRKFPFADDPAYWAGVLAHEMLHNLGHSHPDASASDYHLYQINVLSSLIASKGRFRYGEKIARPFRCRILT